ncbi:MAG: low molecular weight phosphotyrosine protein phosphatase [Anaerolineae bacterium]|nr:low molecular weight phosphotyrosine protein phosphatase [Anaerolineae bacterium]
MSKDQRVLFVCLGNIVRSPLAENMFIHLADQAGVLDKYYAESAGTAAYHVGEAPDARMRRVAAGHGLVYSGRARQFEMRDFERFDIIIAMDASNRENILRLARKPEDEAKVRMMREFDLQGSGDDPVPDPYYGGIDGFEQVYQIVARSCQGLLDAMEAGETGD